MLRNTSIISRYDDYLEETMQEEDKMVRRAMNYFDPGDYAIDTDDDYNDEDYSDYDVDDDLDEFLLA